MSDATAFQEGAFKREIVVTDESGKNTAYYAIYCDDEALLEAELNAYDYSITPFTDRPDFKNIVEVGGEDNLKSGKTEESEVEMEEEANDQPSVVYELIRYNLEEGVKGFALNFNKNELKEHDVVSARHVNTDWYAPDGSYNGTTKEYVTIGDFIGVAYTKDPSPNDYRLKIQRRARNCGWCGYYKKGGEENVYPGDCFWWKEKDGTYYKMKITVKFHKGDEGQFYVYKEDYGEEFLRTGNCIIGDKVEGTFDVCYVGSCPPGTEPFIWGPNAHSLNYYYTPYPEGKDPCPRAGTWFDGANCFYMDIPAEVDHPFTWKSNYYAKTEKVVCEK